MILVIAGTQDGRELAVTIEQAGYSVIMSVTSKYGKSLAKFKGLINDKPLTKVELAEFLRKHKIRVVIDASHPYAEAVSLNCQSVCQEACIAYVRYERPATKLPEYDQLYIALDYEQAAKRAADLGKVLFLTIGSRRLGYFSKEPRLAIHRLIARVLPEPKVLFECSSLGFKPKDIIAMQGPFSHELNAEMFKAFATEVIVTKNSGLIGGTDTKFSAAMELGLAIVVVERPLLEYRNKMVSPQDVLKYIGEIALCAKME